MKKGRAELAFDRYVVLQALASYLISQRCSLRSFPSNNRHLRMVPITIVIGNYLYLR